VGGYEPASGEEVYAVVPGGEEDGPEVELETPGLQPPRVRAALTHVVNLHPQQLLRLALHSGGVGSLTFTTYK
jgi:hypothetical protein